MGVMEKCMPDRDDDWPRAWTSRERGRASTSLPSLFPNPKLGAALHLYTLATKVWLLFPAP